MEKHIAQTLSTATTLKSLCVTVNWSEFDARSHRPGLPTAFKEIIGECKFPQLRSLILHEFNSTQAELVGFLRGSSHLQHLTLTDHILRGEDNWESCANGIKIALPSLKHIIVDNLRCAHSFGIDDLYVNYLSHRDVQGYFFHGKANPFICAQSQGDRALIAFRIKFDAGLLRTGIANKVWKGSYHEFH